MKLLTTMIYDFIMRLIMMIVDVFFNFFNMNFNQISRDYHILKLGELTLMDSSVSNKQKLKIRFREILELVLMVGCGIPVALSIFESFFMLSPAVLLILGAFTFVALAHFLMVNTWSSDCKGSFCYYNNKLNEWFFSGKVSILVFVPIGGLFTIALGLFQVLNPAVAIVFGVMSLAIFFRVALKCWSGSTNDKNRENSNDARKYDFDLSERIWLKFMTIMCPIACILLLFSALAGILSFVTAGVCCIPFGVIGLFTGICFLLSKYLEGKYKKELNGEENDLLRKSKEENNPTRNQSYLIDENLSSAKHEPSINNYNAPIPVGNVGGLSNSYPSMAEVCGANQGNIPNGEEQAKQQCYNINEIS